MKVYVYEIVNTINNKRYVGIHKASSSDYVNDGYWGSGLLIKQAISKYGIDMFEKSILDVFPTYEEALLLEASIVDDDFVNDPTTYNICRGGQGGFVERSPETCERIRQALTGRTLSDEHKAKLRHAKSGDKNPMYGRTHTQESREKMSNANTGKKISVETRQKVSKSLTGRKHTDETKQKMSAAKKGKPGRKQSAETKRKISEARKRAKLKQE